VLVALLALTLSHYLRERRLIQDQMLLSATQLGELALGSLRHAMLSNDKVHLRQILRDINAAPDVADVRLVDMDGQVIGSEPETLPGNTFSQQDPECAACHQYPPDRRPRTSMLEGGNDTLRVATPIDTGPECRKCHIQRAEHLGMLLLDVSLMDAEAHLRQDLRRDLIISLASTLVITAGVYLLVHRLVVARIEAFRLPLARLAQGDLSARLPSNPSQGDEIQALAEAFNVMAEQLQRQAAEAHARSQVRERAIIEERERIARELHDGMAQLLGYVNTKVMAVRLLINEGKLALARSQLEQLENAARGLYVDVREAILGLRMTTAQGQNLAQAVQEYTHQFSHLSGQDVELYISPEICTLRLPAEHELQLMRILQEALTNVRKHAQAKKAWVSLEKDSKSMLLLVADDGRGFDPASQPSKNGTHFGLSTMRERAESMGARLQIDSKPGGGTRLTVHLPLDEDEQYAHPGGR
jgi:signal transduction histidine kinase